MDLNFKKPTHIVALLVIGIAFFFIIVSPVLSFIGIFPSMRGDNTFNEINLDDYVIDLDNVDEEISWSFVGNSSLEIEIINNVATVEHPKKWDNTETITFIATDSDGNAQADDVTFSIYGGKNPTFIGNIQNQVKIIGNDFDEINLDNYLINVANPLDNISWYYSGNSNLSIELINRIAIISYPDGWADIETIIFTATHDNGLSYSDNVTFIVNAEDNVPRLNDILDQTKPVSTIPEIVMIISSIIAVMVFIGAPIIWYLLVNKYGKKQILYSLKLRLDRIDEAFLWGVVAAVGMFILIMAIGFCISMSGIVENEEELSNVEDLASNLSVLSMFFIIVFQSISEEVFFRGFLLEKIDSFAGKNAAIFTTAVLFGIAHLSYGKIYPAVVPIIMGIILGYIVYKTKNLYAAITAHMLFNLASFVLYLFAKSLGI